jgi:putative ABC transport system permease protein
MLILTPALWLLALALLSIRFFPVLMGGVGRIVARWRGVSSLLALRYLTRTPRAYTSPVLLLVLTLSLATFTASMAKTLDSHLSDQVLYDVGAQMRVTDLGESTGENEAGGAAGGGGAAGEEGEGQQGAAEEEPEGAKYLFLPVTDYLKIPGVTGATRVSRSKVTAAAGGDSDTGTALGVDRMDFAEVSAWRRDYAPASLGSLMNALALREDGILVNRAFLEKNNLDVGGKVTLQMRDLEAAKNVPFVVAGVLDYFPTLYPEDGAFFVANLDYVFSAQGGEFPYEVWLNTKPGTSRQQVELGITKLDLRSMLATSRLRRSSPRRTGRSGRDSTGCCPSVSSPLRCSPGSASSSTRRLIPAPYIELGMLRAIGLSTRQMAVLLIWEQALIIGMGILAGTVLGVESAGSSSRSCRCEPARTRRLHPSRCCWRGTRYV